LGPGGGAGYNFSSHHSVIGEFMWSALHPSDGALQPIRAASQDDSITGHSNLDSVTGNYRFEWQWRKLGAYFIGGGGWYYRTLVLQVRSRQAPVRNACQLGSGGDSPVKTEP
jgi:hypothetical protein